MIYVQNVVKTFDGFRALDGLTMRCPDGAIYGLVGPNGAGKSTILRHIIGVYRPDAGNGTDQRQAGLRKSRRQGPHRLHPRRTLRLPLRLHPGHDALLQGLLPPVRRQARYEALKDVFSTIDERTPIRRLSKGMQKQSAFWLALSCRPDLLVLDEPVDGLDPVMRRQVWSLLMGDVAECGTTVLVSSHNLRELEDVCDHVGILSRGKVLMERRLCDPSGQRRQNAGRLPGEGAAPALPEDLRSSTSPRWAASTRSSSAATPTRSPTVWRSTPPS